MGMMREDVCYSKVASDLGLNHSFVKGTPIPIRNCWHFYTSGASVDLIFGAVEDFINGMNRIHTVLGRFDVMILAFVLMDNHLHFILYGELDACGRFVHEYVRRTSMYISSRYPTRKSLKKIEVSQQALEDDQYLKTAICYVLKNPTAAGLPYTPWDYPWSSGALYFRKSDLWTSPLWLKAIQDSPGDGSNVPKIGELIFPGAYTQVSLVEKLFHTPKAFSFFLNKTRDSDMDALQGVLSQLTIPIRELRENRKKLSSELFGRSELMELDTRQRIELARAMKNRYNSSPKQIARTCGLVYEEVKDLI